MSLKRVENIILVLSGKGGVGKSSITTQLALALSLAGHSVGILDIDLTGPNIPHFLGIEADKIKQAPDGWIPVQVHRAQKLAPRSAQPVSDVTNEPTPTDGEEVGALYAMSLGFLLANRNGSIVWRGPKKTAMVRQFLSDVNWPAIDYLLIDTPPGTSDEHISVVETLLKSVLVGPATEGSTGPRLAGAVLVTTPQGISTADVRKEINFCAKTTVPVIGVVENMSGYVCPCCGDVQNIFSKGGGQIMALDFGLAFLGDVPTDGQWGLLVDIGKRPVYEKEEHQDDSDEEDEEDLVTTEAVNRVSEVTLDDRKPVDEGLLIDKYRDCKLYPIFKEIAKQVTNIIERDAATLVNPNAVRRDDRLV